MKQREGERWPEGEGGPRLGPHGGEAAGGVAEVKEDVKGEAHEEAVEG